MLTADNGQQTLYLSGNDRKAPIGDRTQVGLSEKSGLRPQYTREGCLCFFGGDREFRARRRYLAGEGCFPQAIGQGIDSFLYISYRLEVGIV